MSLVGAGSVSNTTAGTSVTWTHGLTIQTNDIILLFANGGGSGTNTFTYPSGFAAVPSLSNINLNNDVTAGVAYKVAGGSEPSSYAVSSSTSDFLTVHGRVYRGRNSASPFSAESTTAFTSAGSFPISCSITGLTAVASDDVVLWLATIGGAAVGESPSLTGPTGFANQGSTYGNVQFSPRIAFADYVNNPGGATGTLSATWSDSTGANPTGYAGYLISIAAAASSNSVPYMPYAFQPTMAQ